MMAFVVASALGLAAVGALAGRLGRGPWSRRVLAVGLALGGLILVARPLPGLRGGDAGAVPACHHVGAR
jgi:hypothetical protein